MDNFIYMYCQIDRNVGMIRGQRNVQKCGGQMWGESMEG